MVGKTIFGINSTYFYLGLVILTIIGVSQLNLISISQSSIIPVSAGTILSVTQTQIFDSAINPLGPNVQTTDTVARMIITPSGGGEYGYVQLQRPLVQIANVALQNNVNIGAQIVDMSCSYPINKDKQTGRFQPQNLTIIPITLNSGNTHDFFCNAAVRISPYTISNVPQILGYCETDFKNVCTQQGGLYLSSQTGAIPLPFLDTSVGGGTGYVCARYGDDTNKLYSYYTSSSGIDSNSIKKIKVNTIITNGISNEVVTVGNYNSNLLSYSGDQNVFVKMDDAAFVPLSGRECQQPSGFYIFKTNAGLLYKKDVNTPQPQQPSGLCSSGQSYSSCINAINNYNSQSTNALLSGATSISSSGGRYSTSFPTSDTGTFDDVRFSGTTQLGAPAFYPVLLVEAKGRFLGITRPESSPQIGSITPNPVNIMSSSDTKQVQVPVTNIGNTGSIVLSTNCPSVSISANQGTSQTYNSGQTITTTFSVSSTANPGTYSCQITASGSNGRNTDTDSFQVNVQQECNLVPYGNCQVNNACTAYVSTLNANTCQYGVGGTCDGTQTTYCLGNPNPLPPSQTCTDGQTQTATCPNIPDQKYNQFVCKNNNWQQQDVIEQCKPQSCGFPYKVTTTTNKGIFGLFASETSSCELDLVSVLAIGFGLVILGGITMYIKPRRRK